MVSVCSCTWKSYRSATVNAQSIVAGMAPKSSCTFTPMAPPATLSTMAAGSWPLPRPRNPKLSGYCSGARSMMARLAGPAQLMSKCGPMVPPTMVVSPPASACSHCWGQRKWAWASTPPGVTMSRSAWTMVVEGPHRRSGWTPDWMAGLPALPTAAIFPLRIPMSAFTTPRTGSMMVAFWPSMSSAPAADVAWASNPMPSRITLPARVIRAMMWSSSSALKAELAGPAECRVPDGGRVDGAVGQVVEAGHRRRPAQLHQRHRLLHAGLEAHRVPGGDVEPHAERLRAVEGQRLVGLEEVEVTGHLDGAVAGVEDLQGELRAPLVQLDVAVRGDHLAWRAALVRRRLLPGPDRPVEGDEAGSVLEEAVHHDPRDERGDAGQHVIGGQERPAPLHQLRDRPTFACAFQDLVGDVGDGLHIAEPQSLRPPLPGEFRGGEDRQPLHLRRRQVHHVDSLSCGRAARGRGGAPSRSPRRR